MTVFRCAKRPYVGYCEAMRAFRHIRAKHVAKGRPRAEMPIRVYRCGSCEAWHLTSMPLALTGDHDTHRKAA